MYPVVTPEIQKQIDEFDKMARQYIVEAIDVGTEGAITVSCEFIKDTFLGQFAPGVASAVMNYRQKRFEKNTSATIEELKLQVQPIIQCFSKMDAEQRIRIGDNIFPLLFDYSADEPEQEKIKLFVNGFCSAVEQQLTEQSTLLFFYDILKSLRMIEIKFLLGSPLILLRPSQGNPKEYPHEYTEYKKWFSEFPASAAQKRIMIKKLYNVNLIALDDFAFDEGLEQEYRIEQFKISTYGNQFIEFFKVRANNVAE